MLIACAAVVGFTANVIVSALASVVNDIPVPPVIVKSSSSFSALTEVWPVTCIFANPKLALPDPLPPPLNSTTSTELILP